jgi:hypothetical protein
MMSSPYGERYSVSASLCQVHTSPENVELTKKLEVARGLADFNWIDAAIAIKAAREKSGTPKHEVPK